jgi:TPR repeat protein
MLHLGAMYQLGTGIPINYALAAEWYNKAANAGNAEAMHNLGGMYEKGQGVPMNRANAAAFYRMAIAHGNVDSKAALDRLMGGQE